MILLRAIDFETSAFEPKNEGDPKPEICEAGWVDIQANPAEHIVRVFDPTASLCNPGVPITAEASGVHHITGSHVADAPSFGEIRPKLFEADPAYFVAHGADLERAMFDGGETPWIDTYKIALRLWPDAPAHKLQVLRYHLGLIRDGRDIGPAHRAGPDAYLCALLMQRIIETDKFSFEDMVRFTNGPALLPRMTIGQHRGKKWEDVPTGFLEWIVGKGEEMGRDLLANAKHHLSKRAGQ